MMFLMLARSGAEPGEADSWLDGTATPGDGAPLAGRVALMAQNDLLMPWLDAVANVKTLTRLTVIGEGLSGDPRGGSDWSGHEQVQRQRLEEYALLLFLRQEPA